MVKTSVLSLVRIRNTGLFRVCNGDTTVRGGVKRDTVYCGNVRNVNTVHFILLWHSYRVESELVALLSLVQ